MVLLKLVDVNSLIIDVTNINFLNTMTQEDKELLLKDLCGRL